ncbi:hypothetical protein CEXT_514951 [Caerostris extrusa]|uniref:Uncharacterized protein n=1 Tax=Caerostris extrusa TaxID=172846 RepID=A0AAV4P9V8_CAEEX|nr:hypothetical protein CEXT_514951 [Caerostris extrusa]
MMKRSLHHPIDFSGVGFGTHHPSSLLDDSSQTGEIAGRKRILRIHLSLPFVDPVCRGARGPWFLVSNHLSVADVRPFFVFWCHGSVGQVSRLGSSKELGQ